MYVCMYTTCKYMMIQRQRLHVKSGGATACQKWGVILYIHYEYIRHGLLVFNMFFMTTSILGALYQKVWGGVKPPLAPFSASVVCFNLWP